MFGENSHKKEARISVEIYDLFWGKCYNLLATGMVLWAFCCQSSYPGMNSDNQIGQTLVKGAVN